MAYYKILTERRATEMSGSDKGIQFIVVTKESSPD
jgi:hypothetical protein